MQKLIRLQIAKRSTVSQRLIQTASGRCPGGIRTAPDDVRTAFKSVGPKETIHRKCGADAEFCEV